MSVRDVWEDSQSLWYTTDFFPAGNLKAYVLTLAGWKKRKEGRKQLAGFLPRAGLQGWYFPFPVKDLTLWTAQFEISGIYEIGLN